MKNQVRSLFTGFLIMYSALCVPAYAAQDKTAWQRWKKPILATTLIAGGIASWYLLDRWIKNQFNHRINETVEGLTDGIKGYSFFNDNGTLRKHPYISDAQFKDYQLHENANFDAMFVPANDVLDNIVQSMKYRISISSLLYFVRSFNIHLLTYQIGSKICFLTSLLGGYLLIQSPTEKSENKKVQA